VTQGGGSPAGQGGGLAAQGGPLAGQGGCAGSRDGWRAAQPGSPGGGSPGAAAVTGGPEAPGSHGAGGSWNDQAGAGVRTESGVSGPACQDGAEAVSFSAPTCVAHPAQ
jgi:hypothetical protein